MSETIVRRAGEEGITPFWRRIPRFFLYPFSPQPLLFMLGLACVTLVAVFIPLLAIPVLFLVTLAFLRYCYAVLDRTAFGQLSAGSADASRYGGYRPWKQLVVLVVYGLLAGLTAFLFGEVPGYVVQYALLILLPANVMWLGVTNSLLASLNVVTLINIVQAIGWPYLALYGFLALLSAAANTASFLFAMTLGSSLFTFPAIALVQMYFTLIAFNMLGYALYQYHDRLGLRVGVERPAPPSRSRQVREVQRDLKGLDAQVKRLLDERRNREATDLLYELVRLNPENRDFNERYRSVLRTTHNTLSLLRHGGHYIDMLVKAGDAKRALEIYRECRQTDPAFHLPEAAQQLALAEAARGAGADDVAVELIQDFDQAFATSAERPAAYLLGARLLHERFGDSGEARRLLEEIVRRPVNDAVTARAREYLAFLAKGSATR
jgi:tetratricopeptide (TPR) repeat protein